MKASTIELNQKDKKKKSTSLPASSVEYLKAWMMSPEHVAHPYPTEKEKAQIMADTGIELKQLTNWFVNNRKRYWKPRVEARLKQQVQAQNAAAVAAITSHQRNGEANRVCFKVGLFPSQVDNSLCQQNFPNEFHPKLLKRPGQTTAISPGAQNTVVSSFQQMSNTENSRFNFGPHHIPNLVKPNGENITDSFNKITNQQYYNPPCTASSEDSSEPNIQVVSMGSTSSFSDCDSTSLSTASHDDNQESIITFGENLSPNTKKFFERESRKVNTPDRTMIIGNAIAHSLSAGTQELSEVSPEQPKAKDIVMFTKPTVIPTLKRVRSVSDFDAYPSTNTNTNTTIIARPRSLTLNDGQETAPKRRFVEYNKSDLNGWQNACRGASHGYDSVLPTLEEAALLFGFATKN